jgi:hypothetical protein
MTASPLPLAAAFSHVDPLRHLRHVGRSAPSFKVYYRVQPGSDDCDK